MGGPLAAPGRDRAVARWPDRAAARRRRRRRRSGAAGLLALLGLLGLLGLLAFVFTALAPADPDSFASRSHRHHHRPGRDAGDRAANRAGAPRHGARAVHRPPPPFTARLRIASGRRGTPVPDGFLGLSFEYWGLSVDERHPLLFDRVMSLLHPRGTRPMTIRIGGDSAQQTFLAPRRRHLSHWAFGVDRRWIARTVRLVRIERLRVIADLNQNSATTAQAVALARRLLRGLPRHTLRGFELGNEPDIYRRSIWDAAVRRTPSLDGRLPAQITPRDYAAEFLADARALRGLERGFGGRRFLLGPTLAAPRVDQRWIQTLLAAPHPDLGAITVHQYPYSACSPPTASNYPTITRLLSHHALGAMSANVAPAVRIARRADLPVSVTEFNSVTCGGRRGVSDSFATALWAPGALFELLSAGVRSADLHARAIADNSPFRWDRVGLNPQPLLYGLLLFVRALGPGARLLPTHLATNRLARVNAWTIALGSGTEHVVILNRGTRRLRLLLHERSGRRLSVQRLLAPDVRARNGITLGGQRLSNRARWIGPRVTTPVPLVAGRAVVSMPPHSAALVTIRGR